MKSGLKIFAFLLLTSLLIGSFSFKTIDIVAAESTTATCVMEVQSGRVLQSENSNAKLPMASTTKIMTALITLDYCDLDDEVIIPKAAVGVEGSSIYLKEGDKRTVEELLYGLMLRSGNDAAVALALHVAGSIEKFALLMNERAAEIGTINTNFKNPHGLHHDEHYTTAADLAKISCVAMKNQAFRKIVGSKSVKFGNRVYYNKNKMLSNYEGATGIKTGYTKKAGRCLVSSSNRDGMEVVCVVLNCHDMWQRSKDLMTRAHQKYQIVDLSEKIGKQVVPVKGGVEQSVELEFKSSLSYPMTAEELSNVRFVVDKRNLLNAPVKKGFVAGKMDVFVDNCLIFSENLYTIKQVGKKSILDWFKEIT